MTPSSLSRLGGWTLVGAAVLCVAGGAMHPIVDGEAHSVEALTSPHEAIGSLLLLAGTSLLLLTLPAVYGRLAPQLGRIGLVGFVTYYVGNLLSAVPHLVVMTFIGPDLARRHPDLVSHHDLIVDSSGFEAEQVVTGVALIVGLLLLAVAAVRAEGLPRRIGVTGLAAVVLLVTPLPAYEVVSGLQVELLRGAFVAALGMVVARSVEATPGNTDARAGRGALVGGSLR